MQQLRAELLSGMALCIRAHRVSPCVDIWQLSHQIHGNHYSNSSTVDQPGKSARHNLHVRSAPEPRPICTQRNGKPQCQSSLFLFQSAGANRADKMIPSPSPQNPFTRSACIRYSHRCRVSPHSADRRSANIHSQAPTRMPNRRPESQAACRTQELVTP